MLVSANFELQNDLHRRVHEYNKSQAFKQTLVKSSAYVIAIMLFLSLLYLNIG